LMDRSYTSRVAAKHLFGRWWRPRHQHFGNVGGRFWV
jgi:hypothetical protein